MHQMVVLVVEVLMQEVEILHRQVHHKVMMDQVILNLLDEVQEVEQLLLLLVLMEVQEHQIQLQVQTFHMLVVVLDLVVLVELVAEVQDLVV